MSAILIIEDDPTIGDLLLAGLKSHGHEVIWCRTAKDGLFASAGTPFDLVLLDLGLPDLDGVEVCRRLRASQVMAVIIMLTARDAQMDIVVGLDAGADDYITKPFGFEELLARVRAHLRRSAVPDASPRAVIGSLVVDNRSRLAKVGELTLPLRPKEFDVLARLAAEPGAAVRRETLMSEVWDENWWGSTKTLDVHIAGIRRKLIDAGEEGGVTPPSIETLRGHGYRLMA